MNVDLLKVDFSKYDSPIQRIVGEMTTQMVQQEEGQMVMQVSQQVGFAVDKDELLKALQYDRDQYKKGYEDGLKASKWISVEDRLPEEGEDVLCWYEYFRYGSYNRLYQTYGIGCYVRGTWVGDAASGISNRIIAWQKLPIPYIEKEGENNV